MIQVIAEIMQGKKLKTSILPPHSIALELCIFVICKHLNFQAFFKTSRHRQFDFKTRYYDAQKEDLDNRVKSAETGKQLCDSAKIGNNLNALKKTAPQINV